jgi:hypothetical protein
MSMSFEIITKIMINCGEWSTTWLVHQQELVCVTWSGDIEYLFVLLLFILNIIGCILSVIRVTLDCLFVILEEMLLVNIFIVVVFSLKIVDMSRYLSRIIKDANRRARVHGHFENASYVNLFISIFDHLLTFTRGSSFRTHTFFYSGTIHCFPCNGTNVLHRMFCDVRFINISTNYFTTFTRCISISVPSLHMHRSFSAKNKLAMDNNPANVPSTDTRMYVMCLVENMYTTEH